MCDNIANIRTTKISIPFVNRLGCCVLQLNRLAAFLAIFKSNASTTGTGSI